MRFAPEYVRSVLAENFEDAKRLFLAPLMAVHRAHLVMLADRGILAPSDAHHLRLALEQVSLDEVARARFDGSAEDLFFHVNALIEGACSPDLAGRLHTARSRNDIDMTMYRMRLREGVLSLAEEVIALRRVLCRLAGEHLETVVALHTHTQPAQPSTIAHYLLAVIEQLERDAERLRSSYAATNRCPLGACAITGTGFPIDRHLTSQLLGFDGPTGNTYGSIAAVDDLLQGVGAAATLLVGLGRFLQDLLLWSTAEFGYLRLGDGFIQGSSIMPQKRNPVALEHARSIASRALGEAIAIQVSVHNTPFGDVVDTEDDLQALVDLVVRDAGRALRVTAAALATARFDPERLAARAAAGGTTLTELADTLVREHGLPFGQAHEIAARVAAAGDDPLRSLPDVLASASAAVTGAPLAYDAARLAEVLAPRHFVRVRATHGGPAPERTREALAASRARLEEDGRWLGDARAAVAEAEDQLAQRMRSL